MRVLHVAAGNLYGGVERILEEIARHGGGRHGFALSFDGRLWNTLSAEGAARHMLGPVRFSRPWSVWRARRRLARVLEQDPFDGVIGHSPWAYALVAPVARGRHLPRVLWAHDALDGSHWTERFAGKRTPDHVICNSRYTAHAIERWLTGVPNDVVYPPVSPVLRDAAARADVRREFGASASTTVILLASRLERWKGHAELLRAGAGLTGDWMIWIAGSAQRPHEAKYEQDLHRLARALPAGERVRFLGARTDVARILQGADVLCQPNTAPEPFGLVFVEALSSGVPVVTTDAGGAREIVTPECGALVVPGDRDALAAVLQGLIDRPERRRALGNAGPARARALCDPATQLCALERALSWPSSTPRSNTTSSAARP
jgi:glycosyltransferase involved in cell wall biosynthesis